MSSCWSTRPGRRSPRKQQWLSANNARTVIDAVQHQRFVTIDFSSSTPGIRNIAAVRRVAEALYPDRFK